MRFVVVDTETGGFKPGVDALLTVGLALFGDVGMIATDELVVNDGRNAGAEALKINGVDMEHVRTHGLSPSTAMMRIGGVLSSWGLKRPMLVAHNAPFDRGFLEQLCLDAGTSWNKMFDVRMVDTMSIAIALGYAGAINTGGFYKLGVVANALGVTMDDVEGQAHGARFDAIMAGRVFVKAIERLRRVPDVKAEVAS